jgi:hypothetical protein
MGLVSKVVTAGVIAKGVAEARKPQNQQKIKELIDKARAQLEGRKSPGGGSASSGPSAS